MKSLKNVKFELHFLRSNSFLIKPKSAHWWAIVLWYCLAMVSVQRSFTLCLIPILVFEGKDTRRCFIISFGVTNFPFCHCHRHFHVHWHRHFQLNLTYGGFFNFRCPHHLLMVCINFGQPVEKNEGCQPEYRWEKCFHCHRTLGSDTKWKMLHLALRQNEKYEKCRTNALYSVSAELQCQLLCDIHISKSWATHKKLLDS